MIPKVVHYVWLGDKPLPLLAEKCIESWRKYLPDYEFILWGNEQAAKIDNLYLQQAIELKKWAFASDFLRLFALKTKGGIYLDTDVEITQPLTSFLNHKFFTGHEVYNQSCSPITAVMAAAPNLPLIHEMLSEYDTIPFYRSGYIDQTTNTHRITELFKKKYGLPEKCEPQNLLTLEDEHIIYPSHYFCTPVEGEVNFSIHHFSGSWQDGYTRKIKYSLGQRLHIIRFAPLKNRNGEKLPLFQSEKIILKLKVSKKIYALIKTI